MTIELQGFTEVFENRVYAAERQATSVTGPVSVLEVLMLSRLTVPSPWDIVDIILQEREPSYGRSSELREHLESLDGLEPEDILAVIDTTQLGEYMRISYGLLDPEATRMQDQEGYIGSSQWYTAALAHPKINACGYGKKWTADMNISDGHLPDWNTIYPGIHLKPSSYISIAGKEYSPSVAERVLRAVYNGMSEPTHIILLEDHSEEVLTELVRGVVQRLLQR